MAPLPQPWALSFAPFQHMYQTVWEQREIMMRQQQMQQQQLQQQQQQQQDAATLHPVFFNTPRPLQPGHQAGFRPGGAAHSNPVAHGYGFGRPPPPMGWATPRL